VYATGITDLKLRGMHAAGISDLKLRGMHAAGIADAELWGMHAAGIVARKLGGSMKICPGVGLHGEGGRRDRAAGRQGHNCYLHFISSCYF
jgi:hypothetical protein